MCGISGILDWSQPLPQEILHNMIRRLSHRGPDAEGVFIESPIGLAHRRLSIIDLNETANQPMQDESGNYFIVFNGEIYNFLSLRQDLEAAGSRFHTNSDTEVLLEAYKKWGTDCLQRLNGMFAFAIWDRPKRRLFLARDRLGEKPLFYFPLTEGGLVFASELKALLAHPAVPRDMDMNALSQYLSFGYVPGAVSIISGIKKLPPGHFLISENGKPQDPVSYWDLKASFLSKRNFRSTAEASEEFRSLFRDVVQTRLISDVPLGAFLSGGIDSSAIVSAMTQTRPFPPPQTFSMGFEEETYSELVMARKVARLLKVDHQDLVQNFDLLPKLSDLAYFADEPFADTSFIPMFSLAEFCKQHVTVCLSGDGGDEILGGYETYIADKLCKRTKWLPNKVREGLLSLTRLCWPVSFGKVSLDYKIRKFLEGHSSNVDRAHASWRILFSEEEKNALWAHPLENQLEIKDPLEPFLKHAREVKECHYLDRAMYVDIKTWLPDDILVKVDRSTMAHGLEARAPFLDYRLVEFAASLPVPLKIRGLQKKYLLKQAYKKYLPNEVLRQKKRGFNAPVSHWITGLIKPYYEDMMENGGPLFETVLCRKTIQSLYERHNRKIQDHGLQLYALIMLHLWNKQLGQSTT
ncbi:asparagine synthase (glutamine-hydrolyzing) [Nitrospinae bacterium]|nr:asparagine synthase (glutamine-hydrolyzing) [Nitrospinota bacterium]